MSGEVKRGMKEADRNPGWRSYGVVLLLVGAALLEGLKLPFRLLLFLKNRRAISEDLQKMLRGDPRA
jgi:hypothetical protein